MKKILVINGHPNNESLCSFLAQEYAKGAQGAGFDVRLMQLADLKFDPVLHKGYLKIQDLEPDLLQAQQDLLWAEHIVIVHPIWWGSVPALLKGFLDRVLLPGFAFKYHKDNPWWDRLLKGRTGRLIVTTDAPSWWNRFILRDPVIRMMKNSVLEFCGIKPVKVTQLDQIKDRPKDMIDSYLKKVHELGKRGA